MSEILELLPKKIVKKLVFIDYFRGIREAKDEMRKKDI
jgi:hypothetical protein